MNDDDRARNALAPPSESDRLARVYVRVLLRVLLLGSR